jgi:transglutaminase-like putative cysteine protease
MFLILALCEGSMFLLNPSLLMFSLGFIKTAYFFYFILRLRNYNIGLLNFRRILLLIAPALIFSVLLFYTFPRFTQGFTSGGNNKAVTSGLHTTLNFSQLGPINLSSKKVFRVSGLELSSNYYWREYILWGYARGEWSTNYLRLNAPLEEISGPKVNYQIQLADDFHEFLPTLDGISRIASSHQEFIYYSEGSNRLRNIIKKELLYSVTTNYKSPNLPFDSQMESKGVNLLSPQKDEIRKLIIGNRNLSTLTDEDKLKLITDYFFSKKFEYSLTPPLYTSVEQFILSGKKGYCSHFAAAYVFMAKTLNLSSRIVVGYQGGEYNPFDKSITVRELDGHVWSEIYLKEKGWNKIDPTGFVAPSRIANGATSFIEQLSPTVSLYYFNIPRSYLNFKYINIANQWWDSISYKFTNSLTNFDKEAQMQIIKNLLPKSITVGWSFILAIAIPLLFLKLGYAYFSRERISTNQKRYFNFLKKMKRYGYKKELSETASAFAIRCQTDKELSPALSEFILSETNNYLDAFYKT